MTTPQIDTKVGTRRGSTLVYSNTAISAAGGASSTDEFTFQDSNGVDLGPNLVGGDLQAGDVIVVRGQVQHTGSNTGSALTLKVKVATETIVTEAFTIAAQNDLVNFEVYVVVNTAGSSGKVAGWGQWSSKLNTIHAVVLETKAEASEDLSGDVQVKVTGTYNESNANNAAKLNFLTVEVMKNKDSA